MFAEIFNINNTVFAVAGQPVSLVELISVILGLCCVVLAGRNSKYNFWFGYVYNIMLFVLFAQRHLYSVMLLQPISFAFNILGQWRWSHPKKEELSAEDSKSLKVSSMPWSERGLMLLIVLALSLVWGYVLMNLGSKWLSDYFEKDPRPFLDAFMLMITLLAIYLSAQKKWECWIVWIFVNIFNIILYLSADLFFMPIVSFIYLLNGIWALNNWYKLYKKGI